MAYGWHLEAEYEDGYVHSEKDLDDQSPYVETGNIFNDIINKRPEADHGVLLRLSLIGPERRFDIDWSNVPHGARPVYWRDMQQERNVGTGESVTSMLMQHFGYHYTGDDGRNHQEVIDIAE